MGNWMSGLILAGHHTNIIDIIKVDECIDFYMQRILLDYWECYWTIGPYQISNGSIALAIGLLGLAKLQQSIASCNFFLSIALLGPTKSTLAPVNSEWYVLAVNNAIHYSLLAELNHSQNIVLSSKDTHIINHGDWMPHQSLELSQKILPGTFNSWGTSYTTQTH